VKFDLRTIKTVLGYGLTRIEKITGIRFRGKSCDSVFNFLQINPNIATSGQPSKQQFKAIQQAGYKKVINLAPHDVENALANEAAVVADLGMDYINIAVDFNAPAEQDFDQFINHLHSYQSQKIWVHCAANMRVSTFIFRYRTAILGEDKQTAEDDLYKIWRPNKIWRQFIDKPEPN
jgi:protein tyrosine phosphatase (PTP) superfamily phosphohydrolase (DUF442 family)